MPVSDRKTLKGVTQFTFFLLSRDRKLLILNGEMSEWLKEHAWKANSSSDTKQLRSTLSHAIQRLSHQKLSLSVRP